MRTTNVSSKDWRERWDMSYRHDSDRATMPVLQVGHRYRHCSLGTVRITARLPNPGGGWRYAMEGLHGRSFGEQNDWALLNQLVDPSPEPPQQLELFEWT